ncbi:MAG: L-rhamnose mutarotase [Bacteroidota bacterium]
MKRMLAILLPLLMLMPGMSGNAADIFVSVHGSDYNAGTREKPLASVAAALRKSRELRRLNDSSVTNGIHIIVGAGVYELYEPLFIRPEDAGTAASPTWIEAAPDEQPVLSGGFQITNWHKSTKNIAGLPGMAQGKVWVADVPLTSNRLSEFRQLWINNVKAVRAKNTNGALMGRILSWDKKEQSCWIPFNSASPIKDVAGIEMFIHQWWAVATLRIRKMERNGDSAKLYFYQPESKIQSEHPWPAPWISSETGNSAFYLTNAIQFLDEPGEWYLDIAQHRIYYWPRINENLHKDVVTAPLLETLVSLQGTREHPVTYVFFKGISFQHAGWLRPSQYGHVPHQDGMYMLDAYKLATPGTANKKTLENQAWIGRPAAAIQVSYADNTGFTNCRFEHLASTGIDYAKYTHRNSINGNLFKDIGGTAILGGVFSDESTEVHIPYNPKDEQEICSDLQITNNLITNVTNEDWGCVGIAAGYVRNSHITHNEISDVSYTGISIGWGWTKTINAMKNNEIAFNKIHHYGKHNYDCAGIYTLSAQPGSVISNNYIDSIYKAPYAHLPNHWFYLYTDEGSSYFTIKDNWCPSEKFLQNANGPGNTWVNNGPQVNKQVQELAGIESAYEYLLKEKVTDKNVAINKEQPVIIELIAAKNQSVSLQKIKDVLALYKINQDALYQWKNHCIIFSRIGDLYTFRQKIKTALPSIEIKTYDNVFYEFNRLHCGDATAETEWSHTILTASLVADPTLQKEYLNYHATQFEKWPEVSKGFCNAGFQQLLAYKNERQLMLVISIPKGETLDRLNPKTTENNPRMVEWNDRMKKYQQGIDGTAKGETWVILKPVQ